ncbi:MAG: T9SS type A sorting domain-containing protein [Firmicutes bacterium]|nr:T9SS type A sorting domain-containing protein [Bacillota bacterium]
MKKLIFTLFSLLLYFNSFAQLNHFFPDTNAYFSVSWMKFHFQGDTIIDNFKYKKVYMQAHDSIADFNKAYYFAAIREDTIAEKVYCYTEDYYYGAREYLLYDFSVNVGDVVNFYSFWCGLREVYQVVESIDSILIDNHYRKRINFVNDYPDTPNDSWIEGIGSTHGLFFAGHFDVVDAMDWTYLLCVHIDGELIYQNPDILNNNCYIREYGNNIIENKRELLKIYPTFADNALYIETYRDIENFEYKIINIRGQIMNSGIFTSNTINISNLGKGFYLIMVADNKSKKSIATQKFIKH